MYCDILLFFLVDRRKNSELKDQDQVLLLLHRACMNVLQHTAVLVCLKSTSVKDRTVRVVCSLFMKIIRGAYLENNIAFREYTWNSTNIFTCIDESACLFTYIFACFLPLKEKLFETLFKLRVISYEI